jgi:hypothetical protein
VEQPGSSWLWQHTQQNQFEEKCTAILIKYPAKWLADILLFFIVKKGENCENENWYCDVGIGLFCCDAG